jgi:hypothetical protein
MFQPQRQIVGRAVSVNRQLRPKSDNPKSVPGIWRYFPAEFECVRIVPTMVCKFSLVKIHRDLFYLCDHSAQRAALGIAKELNLPFILGLKDNKRATKSDLALLNIERNE